MKGLNNRSLLAIIVVAVLVIAAAAGAVSLMNNNNDTSKKDYRVDTDVGSMTWNQILDEAKGQEVYFGFYIDEYTIKWMDDYLVPEAAKYGVTLEYDPYFWDTSVILNEYKNGKTTSGGTYDLIWGGSSTVAYFLDNEEKVDLTFKGDWVSKMDSAKYLPDSADEIWAYTYESATGKEYSRSECAVATFTTGVTTLLYNQDFCADTVKIGNITVNVPYDVVTVYNTDGTVKGFIKVATADSSSKVTSTSYTSGNVTVKASDVTSADYLETATFSDVYDLTAVRNAVKAANGNSVKGVIAYGLPGNFTELCDWTKIYKGQYTYPSPSGSASFHTTLLMDAMVYELTWADQDKKTGWTAVTDDMVWEIDGKKVTHKEYIDSKMKSVSSADEYYAVAGYIMNYLKEIEPYCDTSLGHYDSSVIGTLNHKLVGYGTDAGDFNDDTVMIGYTVCPAPVQRSVDEYEPQGVDIGVIKLETACSEDYTLQIPCNASNKAGAIVVASLINSPYLQGKIYELAGNAYNIDINKLSDEEYSKYFSFIDNWRENESGKYIDPEELSENRYADCISSKVSYLKQMWKDKL